MSPLGDDAEKVIYGPIAALGDGERPWPRDKGGASMFCPPKWQRRPLAGIAETMPRREPGHTARVLGVTPDSHVTQKAKEMANAGRAPAAGLVAGAWVLSPTCLKRWSPGVGPE